MYNPKSELITLDDLEKARSRLKDSEHCVRTPMLHNTEAFLALPSHNRINLHLKLENFQLTGSFKVRGVLNQLLSLPEGCGSTERPLVSMSAGNYGRSFAYLTQKMKMKGVIFMPETAPVNRAHLIQSYGVTVHRCPTELLQSKVDEFVSTHNAVYLHSFDDTTLMAGHASVGLEILEDVPNPDVILVCCGGGGLLSGIASAVKLSGRDQCRVYGVEPEGSPTMYESYRQGKPVTMAVSSIASGLSPPFAGSNAFRHCRRHVTDVLLVSDEEIVTAMTHLYGHGLVVEPSGAAAFAAVFHDKVPDVEGKRVVAVVTGGNVTPHELVELSARRDVKE